MALALPSPAHPACDSSVDEDLSQRIRLFSGTLRLAVLQRIHIEVKQGVVTIDGAVRSFYERQLALACVRRVAGVRQITDRIHVIDS